MTPNRHRKSNPQAQQPFRAAAAAPPRNNRTLFFGLLLGGIPVIGLALFLLLGRREAPQSDTVEVPATPPTPHPIATPTPEPVTKPESRPDLRDYRAVLTAVRGNDPVATRWNKLVVSLNSLRDAEQYVRFLDELNAVAAEARNTPHSTTILSGLRSIYRAITVRSESVFSFLDAEAHRLAEAGKYGDACDVLDSYPLNLDIDRKYGPRLDAGKTSFLSSARAFYETLKKDADSATAENRYTDAKNTLLRALETGIDEIVDDAYARLSSIVEKEDLAIREKEEEGIRDFENEIKARGELGQMTAALRRRFWEQITGRKLDAAAGFLADELKGERGSIAGYRTEIETLQKVHRDVVSTLGIAERWLATQTGQILTLTFAQGAVSTIHLKRASGGSIVCDVEGKEVVRPLSDLHATQLEKISRSLSNASDAALLLGLAQLLQDDFAAAHETLAGASDQGSELRAFVESSSSYLEGNAGIFWTRAAEFETRGEFDRAIQEYSKLSALPAHREKALKSRAKAAYQAGNYVSTVLDISDLFDSGSIDTESIDLLNMAYKRATLIDRAVTIYEKARKKFPQDARVLANLVALYMQIHEFDKAQEALASAKRLKNFDPQLFSVSHLLPILSKNHFAGQVYWMRVGRYRVETNVSQERANEIARFMDKVYGEYSKYFPYRRNETLVFHVKLFRNQSEFAAYHKAMSGEGIQQGLGVLQAWYMPLTKELVGWDSPGIFADFQHESLHQFMDYFIDDCPMWFNEGYASYFETSTADMPRFNPERHQTCAGALMSKQLPSLKDLLLMTPMQWKGEGKGVLYYGQSWSFIYFLVRQGRKDILDTYMDELMKGKSQEQAFETLFGPGKVNLAELEAKWRLAVFREDY